MDVESSGFRPLRLTGNQDANAANGREEFGLAVRKPRATNPSGTQARALGFLSSAPGATIQAVAGFLLVTHSTAAYHLETLYRRGLITREREGRVVRHFSVSTGRSMDHLRLDHFMREPRAARVLTFISNQGSVWTSVNGVARSVGLSHAVVFKRIRDFERHGLVEIRQGRSRYTVRASPKSKIHEAIPLSSS